MKRGLTPEKQKDAQKQLSDLEKTMVEQYHGAIENRAVHILDGLRASCCSFFNDSQGAIDFIYFLTQQFVRTPMLRKISESLSNPIPGLDLNRTIGIEAHIYASNIGAGIFAERDQYRFKFLTNSTPVPFLTSDQPVINLNTEHDKDLRLYYPLGPRLALIFHKGVQPTLSEIGKASPIEIELYNQRIYLKSTDQIYSNDRKYLERVVATAKDVLTH